MSTQHACHCIGCGLHFPSIREFAKLCPKCLNEDPITVQQSAIPGLQTPEPTSIDTLIDKWAANLPSVQTVDESYDFVTPSYIQALKNLLHENKEESLEPLIRLNELQASMIARLPADAFVEGSDAHELEKSFYKINNYLAEQLLPKEQQK